MNDAHTWLRATCGDDSFREIGRKAGLSDSIISRQLNGGHFSFEVAVAIARTYGASVLGALLANGLLTEDEAGSDGIEAALQVASDEQLVAEVGRRLDVKPSSTLWDAPVSEAVESATNVVQLHQPPKEDDDPRAVASERSDDVGEDNDGYDA